MFSTLKLFSQVPCPDPSCSRSPCLFSHDPAIIATRVAATPSANVVDKGNKATVEPKSVTGVKRKAEEIAKRPEAMKVNAHGVIISGGSKMAKSTTTVTVARPAGSNVVSSSSKAVAHSVSAIKECKAPMLIVNTRLSKQPIIDRKKALQRLFEEFCRLYSDIISLQPTLPGEHATQQESDIAAATSKATYHSNVQSTLISIRARTKPNSLDSPYVGTVSDSAKKVAEVETRKASRLTKTRLDPYLLERDELVKWRYMTDIPEGPGGTEPDALGQVKTCDRCRVEFTVSDTIDYVAMAAQRERGECIYHWGRLMPIRQEGRKIWVYSCCREPRGSEGCSDGLHVFKDGDARGLESTREDTDEGDKLLHKRLEFKLVAEVRKEAGKEQKPQDVVAMDCEMIYTTAGLSLARVTVLAEDGRKILDEFVRQEHIVLDLNTKFSGLTMPDLQGAALDIRGARRALCAFVGPQTVIIGHGLENDLRAMRIVHSVVVDTAVVFPHHKGPPYRRSLKDLTSEKLGVFIQSAILDEGHDSTADAKAALDLMKWKVKEDHARGLHVD